MFQIPLLLKPEFFSCAFSGFNRRELESGHRIKRADTVVGKIKELQLYLVQQGSAMGRITVQLTPKLSADNKATRETEVSDLFLV